MSTALCGLVVGMRIETLGLQKICIHQTRKQHPRAKLPIEPSRRAALGRRRGRKPHELWQWPGCALPIFCGQARRLLQPKRQIDTVCEARMMGGNHSGQKPSTGMPITFVSKVCAGCGMIPAIGAFATNISLKLGGYFSDVMKRSGKAGDLRPSEDAGEFARARSNCRKMVSQKLPLTNRSS